MLLKLKIIYIISCLTGIYTQRPSCAQIDFNDRESIAEIESCEDAEMFEIKSYADVSIESFRNVENHLSNVDFGLSCFRTAEIFNLDSYTEIDLLIYLNSLNAEDDLFLEIQAFDTEEGIYHSVGIVTVSNEWNVFHANFNLVIPYAQIEIRANTNVDTLLAIEYLHIINPRKAEPNCRRTTTISTALPTVPTEPETDPTTTESDTSTTEIDTSTTEIDTSTTEIDTSTTEIDTSTTEIDTSTTESDTSTTESDTSATESDTSTTESDATVTVSVTESETTVAHTSTVAETDTATETPTTQIPTIPTNPVHSNVWTVLSFTFFLTTIVATATLIYIIILYKSAAVMSKSLMMAPSMNSSLPRLTIANGKSGDHIIVGIENGYNGTAMKSKYF